MGQVRIADLPTTDRIDANSFIIVEKPGVGDGTFKSTVGHLQESTTVIANVTRNGRVITINIKDINGETQEDIVTPEAKIRDNGDNTLTITLSDAEGTSSETIFRDSRIVDPEPIEGSQNLVNSGSVYKILQQSEELIREYGEKTEDRAEQIAQQLRASVDGRISIFKARLDKFEERLQLLELIVMLKYNTLVLDEHGAPLVTEQDAELLATIFGSIQKMREEGGFMDEPYVSEETGQPFATFEEAVAVAAANNGTIKLLGDGVTPSITIPESSNLTVNLNGHSLFVVSPGETIEDNKKAGIKLLKNSNITFQDGSLIFNDIRLNVGIKNYANLVLDHVTLAGDQTIECIVSSSFGISTFRNETKFTAVKGNVAFGCYYGTEEQYDDPGTSIIIEDRTVKISGYIDFGKADRASGANFGQHASISCPRSMEIEIRKLEEPCDWFFDNNLKTIKYIGS